VRLLVFITFLYANFLLSAGETVRLATTTSVAECGILDALLPVFERHANVSVRVVAVGSGGALKLGERGDVDIVLVHAPDAEERFVAAGYAANRRYLMTSSFVIVGPMQDPAGVRSAKDAVDAFRKIAQSGALFVSRGDDSGTHQKEREIWREAGITPQKGGKSYLEAGQGMSSVLRIADEKDAYTLADRATYEKLRSTMRLTILIAGDRRLESHYSIMTVNPQVHPRVKHEVAERLLTWLTSAAAREIITSFEIAGKPVFFVGIGE